MQLRARRVIAQNVEADIAGADQVAAGNGCVDVVDGALERGAAPRGAQAREPADALVVDDLDLLAARAGAQESGALPLVQAAADRLAGDAEIGGDVTLRDLLGKAHAVALGDADIRRELHQPVGEEEIGKGVHLLMLLGERGKQPLRADADEARAQDRVVGEKVGKKRERERHDGSRRERDGRGRALDRLRHQSVLQELELAEDLAVHDALEAEHAFSRRRLQLDLHQGIDVEPIAIRPRPEKKVDRVRRIARVEHAFAGLQRAHGEPRAAQMRAGRVACAAHQRGSRDQVFERFLHTCGRLGRQAERVVHFGEPHQAPRQRRQVVHGKQQTSRSWSLAVHPCLASAKRLPRPRRPAL